MWYSRYNKQSLNEEASMAIAWGRPDNESTGMSHSELISIISRLLARVEYLEDKYEPRESVEDI